MATPHRVGHGVRARVTGAAVALALSGAVAACAPPDAPPSPPPPVCSVAERHEIEAPVERSGVMPPGFPPGHDFSVQYSDSIRSNYIPAFGATGNLGAMPVAETVSEDGRWHMWAVAEGDDWLNGFRTEKVHLYARDTHTDDPPGRVAYFDDVPDMYERTLTSDGTGHPHDVAIPYIDPDGNGFVVASDFREFRSVFYFPSPQPPEEARLMVFHC